jgi:hypothetical protein
VVILHHEADVWADFPDVSHRRVLADTDDIYYNRRTRLIFVADDNLVLDPDRVIEICDANIARNYKGLNLIVQAYCISMSRNEEMVRKMSLAGMNVFRDLEAFINGDAGRLGSQDAQAVNT